MWEGEGGEGPEQRTDIKQNNERTSERGQIRNSHPHPHPHPLKPPPKSESHMR